MKLKGRFYYSEKQKERKLNSEWMEVTLSGVRLEPKFRNFCRLKNGRVVEYTEMISSKKGIPIFDDAVFLGYGEYDHSERL